MYRLHQDTRIIILPHAYTNNNYYYSYGLRHYFGRGVIDMNNPHVFSYALFEKEKKKKTILLLQSVLICDEENNFEGKKK